MGHYMTHCLLLGNGINRVALQKPWTEILEELAIQFDAADLIPQIKSKPLSMFIEELSARSAQRFRHAEMAVKIEFAKLLEQINPIDAHERVCSPFKVIMTTNYDFTAEEAFVGPMHHPAFLARESRYSLFRRHQAGDKDIWHVHGDISNPGSMLLGFDHYAGNLQRIRNYVTGTIELAGGSRRVSSPVKAGNHAFLETHSVYSWIDYFLRDHIHIVGLGMDFTEIDLWWLLLHKRRRDRQSGKVFFYETVIGASQPESPVASLMRSLGVEVVSVSADDYRNGYLKTADLIEERIHQYPQHFPKPQSLEQPIAQPDHLIPRKIMKDAKSRQPSLRLPKQH
ncbi:hypothetical protein ACVW0Y_003778 [Pseudomonas sp. TE3786]